LFSNRLQFSQSAAGQDVRGRESAEPWFSVRENDVFPEEFLNFLHLPGPARTALFEQHADLFHPDFLVQRATEASRRRDSGSISISAGATVVAAN
jgi:isocitrate dehydrogenase kinase/phosphatase